MAVSSTLLTLMAYQDPGAYNLLYGKVFSAMPTCPVMTISRRADEPRSRRRSRGQDEEGRQYIGVSASWRTSQDEEITSRPRSLLGWADSDTDDSDAGTVESILFGSAWNSSWV